jgi:pimeloyl-ACP methyl ester carboxylesterase
MSDERIQFSEERVVQVGEIELAYQAVGDPHDPAMLMIMGLGAQMIYWPDGLCELLASRGFHLIRFDNRDSGHSTKLSDAGAPSLMRMLAGERDGVAYTLTEMASDAAGLLDHLEIPRAHLVGASLGGMVAQTLAVEHPERVLSLASIMSTTGAEGVGQPHDEIVPLLLTPMPAERNGYVSSFLAGRAAIGSRGLGSDEAATRRLAERAYERGYFPDGTARQLAAIIASGDRTPALGRLQVPTVVIHGERDPLIDVSGGRATAGAIPGAELLVIPDLGHDLPWDTWEPIVDAIVANAARSHAVA